MTRCVGFLFLAVAVAIPLSAQSNSDQPPPGFKSRDEAPKTPDSFTVPSGTHVLLSMINSVSSKEAQVGDRIYLETAFPVVLRNHIVIPQGSYVTGTVTHVKRPARGRRRGELSVRFDSLILPNGVTRSFDSDLGSIDARDPLKHEHDNVSGKESGDPVGTVAVTTASGAGLGAAIGAATGHAIAGAGVGAGAGAAAGMVGVLLSHGPDAMLHKGATLEMVLDRPLTFESKELDFGNAPPHATMSEGGPQPRTQPHRLAPGIPW